MTGIRTSLAAAMLAGCAPTSGPNLGLDEAIRLGVPTVSHAPALVEHPVISLYVEPDAIIAEARGQDGDVVRHRLTDLATQGHLVTALYDALAGTNDRPLVDPFAPEPVGVELWAPADADFLSVVELLYTAGRARARDYVAVVRTPEGVGALSFRPPRFDGEAFPPLCVRADVHVDDERLELARRVVRSEGDEAWLVVPIELVPRPVALTDLGHEIVAGLHSPLCDGVEITVDEATSWQAVTEVLAEVHTVASPGEVTIAL